MVERWTPEREVGGSETYLCRVVFLSKALYSLKAVVIPRKQWLHPDMTEKLLTRTLYLNTNKQTKFIGEGGYTPVVRLYISFHFNSIMTDLPVFGFEVSTKQGVQHRMVLVVNLFIFSKKKKNLICCYI